MRFALGELMLRRVHGLASRNSFWAQRQRHLAALIFSKGVVSSLFFLSKSL